MCRCGAIALLGQTPADILKSEFRVEFYGGCKHLTNSQAGQLSGSIKGHMRELMRYDLGPGRDPSVCFQQVLTILGIANPDIQRYGNKCAHGTKKGWRSFAEQERDKDRLSTNDIAAVVALKNAFIRQEKEALPPAVFNTLLAQG